MEKTREEIAAELLTNCPEESLVDHEWIAAAILNGHSKDTILDIPECDRWPETYAWLKGIL